MLFEDFPSSSRKLVLHACCAPCSCGILKDLLENGFAPTVFYYNPNVHPLEEYETRKRENKRFADKLGVPFVDGDYEREKWFCRVQGLENEPERGARCTTCFAMRLERTALFAHDNGFDVFATSLGLSRHKDQAQVYAQGQKAAAFYDGSIAFWGHNWRKNNGEGRANALAKEEQFYRQTYCGCLFSRSEGLKKRLFS